MSLLNCIMSKPINIALLVLALLPLILLIILAVKGWIIKFSHPGSVGYWFDDLVCGTVISLKCLVYLFGVHIALFMFTPLQVFMTSVISYVVFLVLFILASISHSPDVG